jgi:hypothetical protein
MTWIDWLPFVAFVILYTGGILIGYWMGRNSSARHFRDYPKPALKIVEPKKTHDPYAAALAPDRKGRISTVEE